MISVIPKFSSRKSIILENVEALIDITDIMVSKELGPEKVVQIFLYLKKL